jgi:predicted DNA-binding protein (MmcQ/YjbR family)
MLAMDAEIAREFLLKLPYVEETMQWGENLVFWVGDKAIGGKMFAILNLDADGRAVIGFSAGPDRFHDLLEIEGVFPAPYLARAYWVSIEHWDAISGKDMEDLLRAAHELIYQKLPQRTRDVLALPAQQYRKLLAARKKLLVDRARREPATRAAAKSAPKSLKEAAKGSSQRSRDSSKYPR